MDSFPFDQESVLMRFARGIGMERIAWALRRLHCPVPKEALVLEVGSGGKPYFRSNVLLDGHETPIHRYGMPFVVDRPTVVGFVENLPFQDQTFDFVVASHVLEHSAHPEVFLSELQRVARAGYIEVPDAFGERVNPYRFHKLEIALRDETLVIYKKRAWIEDPYVVELYERHAKELMTRVLMPRHPSAFIVRYYWRNTIRFTVLNPEVDATWELPESLTTSTSLPNWKERLNALVLGAARALLSQHARNRAIDVVSMLRCPNCKGSMIRCEVATLVCNGCRTVYPVRDGIPVMYPLAAG